MIRLPDLATLSPEERFGLQALVDLARLVPCESGVKGVVELRLIDEHRRSELDRLLSGAADIHQRDGEISIARGTLRQVTAVVGAATEQRTAARDRHGRVPSASNPLVAAGREREAVVQRLAARLREAAIAVAGRRLVRCLAPWPDGRRWAVAMTHDLDVVAGWPIFTAARMLELGRRGRWLDVGRVLGAAVRGARHSPVHHGVRHVLNCEAGLASTWFVLAGTPSLEGWRRGDVTYRLESRRTRTILDAVRRAGHEIALHGSMCTMDDDGSRFSAECHRLAATLDQPVRGVRQHFLRVRLPTTPIAMARAGFQWDATMGFPDRNGFRLGVADVVPLWDATARAPVGLDEVPLTWMDRALSKYGGEDDPDRWVSDALDLAAEVRRVEGLWVGLWHPNLVPALGFPSAPEALGRMLDGLVAGEPWAASVSTVVAWRTARRALRAAAVGGDSIRYRGPVRWPGDLVLEDGAGKPVERRPWPA